MNPRVLLGLALLTAGCRAADQKRPRDLRADSLPVLVGAGDIADCASEGRMQTARILDTIPGTVFVAGDAAYRRKKVSDPLHACYDDSWGRHKQRTRPTPGNHEYDTGDATAYFTYFGSAAGPPNGYYSYQLGTWHVIALNSAIGVGLGSPQLEWLRSDLGAHAGECMVAYMHHPRFSSGPHDDRDRMRPVWRELVEHRVAIAIAGHDHIYERFTPMDVDGNRDTVRGVRQFVVGTGGADRYTISSLLPGSEAHSTNDFGVLKLTLLPTRYRWEFIPVNPDGFHDRGEDACHPVNVAR